MRYSIFAASAFAVMVPVSAMASVKAEILAMISERSATYQGWVDRDSDENKRALNVLLSPGEHSKEQLEQVFITSDSRGYSLGRKVIADDFGAFLKTGPNSARAEIWMQEHVSQVQRVVGDVERSQRAANAMPLDTEENARAKLDALTKARALNGSVRGMVDELQLTEANLRTYLQNKAEGRLRWAVALKAIGDGLQSMPQTPLTPMPPLSPPPQPIHTTCQRFGNTTHCTSQ